MNGTAELFDHEGKMRPVADIEDDAILHAVAHCGGNLTETRKGLRISRNTLYRRLWQLGFFEKVKIRTRRYTIRR